MGWGNLKLSAGLLAGLILSACASAPAEPAVQPLELCQKMSADDAGLVERLARDGADLDDFCACFVTIEADLDADTRLQTFALMRRVIEMREGTGRTTEDVAELLEDDRDGSLYGIPEGALKQGAQPIEDSLTRARRNPQSCRAS
ncbi:MULTISPECIES: hypothetical protein [Hyphomonas]|uniref:Uncharacterized protein n=1 Tax=Hyphomonas adhaerens TaxID=81029 RepID=A0A3B9GT19_9PROT|nr:MULTISPECIES: hypothetical protein [Hyphomonas]MBB39055.1 hypothetical protein [Hyphomonas sp.]HAE25571.1 hypothetical protein [Hyphomonas adhaerens]|tara:strand:- start:1925 stop:2359 length:435 start_codon:yes stop_codon:yes gene_type:complete